MIRKCAFFDFDDTIAHGDSIHRFLIYTIKKHPLSIFRFMKTFFLGIGYLFHIVSKEQLKSSILFGFDYFSNEKLEYFYKHEVIPTYYPHMVEELKKRQDEGCIVFLVTASSEGYMKYTDLPIDVLMGTITEIKNSQYTSKIVGDNCKGQHKVTRIEEYCKIHDIQIDYDHSYGYSDSISDKPMLLLVKNRYKVNKKDGSLSEFILD